MSMPMQPPALPSLAELQEIQPEATFIGPLFDRRQARDWALVLQSQNISYILQPVADGLALKVSPLDHERAIESIDLYEVENANWPPPVIKDTPRHASSLAVPLTFMLLVLFFFYVTGPVAKGSVWFVHGRADALRFFQEPWRVITALALHADAQHVIGNAISGSIFGMMVSRRIGPGGALLAILTTGAVGNALNALHHLPDGHRSIGASTAVFGAVGLLAAVQTVIVFADRSKRRRFGLVDMLAPVIGGLALLGALGAGKGNTDLWAHGYGFLAGVLIGIFIGLSIRNRSRQPSKAVQGVSLLASAAIMAGAWALALLT